jgi:hypothetical protein
VLRPLRSTPVTQPAVARSKWALGGADAGIVIFLDNFPTAPLGVTPEAVFRLSACQSQTLQDAFDVEDPLDSSFVSKWPRKQSLRCVKATAARH